MAKVYRAKQDVSFPRPLGKISGEGDDAVYETEGVNYAAGDFVKAENLTPRNQKRAESGELDHLLEPVDYEGEIPTGEPSLGVFIPEHEAERHALQQYGHVTVSKEQELELLSQSEGYDADYQQAVKEHGLDRRHALEAQQADLAEQNIPREVLLGAETRSGLPHNRGPEDETLGDDDDEGDDDSSESQASEGVRPRPGGTSSEQTAQEAVAEQNAEQKSAEQE